MTTNDCDALSGELAQPLGSILLGSSPCPLSPSDLSLELALVDYLSAQDSIACLVAARFYPFQVDRQNKIWPVVTYARSGTEHQNALNGSAGYATAHIELDVWSPNFSDCVVVAETIRQALQGFHGYWGAIGILSCLLDDESSDCEKPADGSGTFWFSRSLDYSVMYMESIPVL